MSDQLWIRADEVERQFAKADADGGGTIHFPAGEFATGVFRRVTEKYLSRVEWEATIDRDYIAETISDVKQDDTVAEVHYQWADLIIKHGFGAAVGEET